MSTTLEGIDPLRLFADYLRVTGVAHTGPEAGGDERLLGKRLGLLNGSSWITLWANYFGRRYLPGVHLINCGSEAVQVNFMEAHHRGEPCPPESNIRAFERAALELAELGHVDAVLITCSTMNRAYRRVQSALAPAGVPVVQIDQPMMRRAVEIGGRTLVVATHGPTVAIGCVGIANPLAILHRVTGPGRLLTAEMSPREGALAAQWLGLETVLPCHYIEPECEEVREFNQHLEQAKSRGQRVPRLIVMRPGQWIDVEPGAIVQE